MKNTILTTAGLIALVTLALLSETGCSSSPPSSSPPPPASCSKMRPGTYRFSLTLRSSSCGGKVGSSTSSLVTVSDDMEMPRGCTQNGKPTVSRGGCTSTFSFSCEGVAFNGYLDCADAACSSLSGELAAGDRRCDETYSVTYTRVR